MSRRLIGGLAASSVLAATLSFAAAAPAMAYVPCQGGSTLTVNPPTVGPGGGTVTITGTFTDCNGHGIAGATVTLSVSGPCNVTIPATAVTDANGSFSVTVKIPPSCPGQFTFSATLQGVTVRAVVMETGGFAATGAELAVTPGPSLPALLLLVIGCLCVATGLAVVALRARETRP